MAADPPTPGPRGRFDLPRQGFPHVPPAADRLQGDQDLALEAGVAAAGLMRVVEMGRELGMAAMHG